MKKILAAILSVSLCGVMLSACGNDSGTDTELTESVTSAAAENDGNADGGVKIPQLFIIQQINHKYN